MELSSIESSKFSPFFNDAAIFLRCESCRSQKAKLENATRLSPPFRIKQCHELPQNASVGTTNPRQQLPPQNDPLQAAEREILSSSQSIPLPSLAATHDPLCSAQKSLVSISSRILSSVSILLHIQEKRYLSLISLQTGRARVSQSFSHRTRSFQQLTRWK